MAFFKRKAIQQTAAPLHFVMLLDEERAAKLQTDMVNYLSSKASEEVRYALMERSSDNISTVEKLVASASSALSVMLTASMLKASKLSERFYELRPPLEHESLEVLSKAIFHYGGSSRSIVFSYPDKSATLCVHAEPVFRHFNLRRVDLAGRFFVGEHNSEIKNFRFGRVESFAMVNPIKDNEHLYRFTVTQNETGNWDVNFKDFVRSEDVRNCCDTFEDRFSD